MSESGLSDVIGAIESNKDDVSVFGEVLSQLIKHNQSPLSLSEAASPNMLSKSLSKFAKFLKGLDVISSPRLILLSAHRLPGIIHQEALLRLCIAYGKVCEAVTDPNNKYEFVGTLLGSHQPFGQISTLRQLLGLSQDS